MKTSVPDMRKALRIAGIAGGRIVAVMKNGRKEEEGTPMSAGPAGRHCYPLLRRYKKPAFSLLLLSINGNYFPKHPVGLPFFTCSLQGGGGTLTY